MQVVDRTIHGRVCSVGPRLPIDDQFPCQWLAEVFKLLQANELEIWAQRLGRERNLGRSKNRSSKAKLELVEELITTVFFMPRK